MISSLFFNLTNLLNLSSSNFNITFPITDKTDVKGEDAHDLYKWAKKNYGNSTVPKWNFHKILINKEGKIQDTFNSFITPMSDKIIKQIDLILKSNSHTIKTRNNIFR